jgi:hypothetical protein
MKTEYIGESRMPNLKKELSSKKAKLNIISSMRIIMNAYL